MAHQHKGRGQRKAYTLRFQSRYGMTPTEWRELKETDPQQAHIIRMRIAKK